MSQIWKPTTFQNENKKFNPTLNIQPPIHLSYLSYEPETHHHQN